VSQPPSESSVRLHVIDHQLERAGWSVSRGNLRKEFRLIAPPGQLREDRAIYATSDEFADYVLLGRDDKPLAIVEAKRTSRDAYAGKRQAADYADRMKALYGVEPFVFLCNGDIIRFWDRAQAAPRLVSGFFTIDDLERLDFQRRYQQLLSKIDPKPTIVDRPYQLEAVRRVTEGLEREQRKFLLVLATGTGKTRIAIALADLLVRANWIQRVLFLADRRELVKQALDDFETFLPSENHSRIEGRAVDDKARIHIATYPSMLRAYRQLSPGYYDLVIADESHRSIYQRYRVLFEHFDALQLGLTATPVDFLERNTFELFDCPTGLPTFSYPFEIAVREGYLADYRVLDAQTNYQIEGIKAGQLPTELQQQLEAQGVDLEDLDFEGSDLERTVINTGTNDALVQEFLDSCRKDATGTLPAKSIMFAMSHRHAMNILESFQRLRPDLTRRGVVEVIDSHMERVEKLIEDFKRRDMPRVAISVDMLDTGVDVPAVQNLAIAKPVFSRVKFWQMIGRGSRLWINPQDGKEKRDFLIIDHWGNFDYFNMQPHGEVASQTEALPVQLFRARLEKLALLRGQKLPDAVTVADLQAMLARLPDDNVNLRSQRAELDRLENEAAWLGLEAATFQRIHATIAPLLRFLPDINLLTMSFELRTEQLAVAHLKGDLSEVAALGERIREDLSYLPRGVEAVQAHVRTLDLALTEIFWQCLDVVRIDLLRRTFAPLMPFRSRGRREVITLHLPDTITQRRWIVYGPAGETAFADSYREQAEAQVRQLADDLPALTRLRQGQSLDERDLEALDEALNRPDLFVTDEVLRQIYNQPQANLPDFLRHILGLSRLPSREEQITAAFDAFIAMHPRFTAAQLMFLRTVRSAVLRQARLTTEDLERPPFSRVGAVRSLFSTAELDEMVTFANSLAA
jgi:type I restriction enzyme, R subunit